MQAIKEGLTQTVTQLFAIGQTVLAIDKAKRKREEIQKDNDDLVKEYLKDKAIKTFDDLSKAILLDGQSDPKWKKEQGVPVGYQKAIKEFNSVGAAGYNSFRAYCAKWYDKDLQKKTPEDLKAEKETKAAEKGEKLAAEVVDMITTISTADLIAELRKRAEAGDPEAKGIKFPKVIPTA